MTNRKAPERCGKVQLIDATSFWAPMRRSLGDKRREIPPERIDEVVKLRDAFEEGEHSKVFDNNAFGYRKITVERPLRLNFQASPERIGRLDEQRAFANLPVSKKKESEKKSAEEAAGRAQQEAIQRMLATMPGEVLTNRAAFLAVLDEACQATETKLAAPVRVLAALSERDESAEICRDKDGEPEPDPDLRDFEHVPLTESVRDFFDREVAPHVPDAWINETVRDHKDGKVGKVGCEINFNRHFCVYEPSRPLEEIEADIKEIEKDILELLREVAG